MNTAKMDEQIWFFDWFFHKLACLIKSEPLPLEEYLLKKSHRYFPKGTVADNSNTFEMELRFGTTLQNVFDDIRKYYKNANAYHKEGNVLVLAWVNPKKPDTRIQIEITEPEFEPPDLFGESSRANCKITIS